MRLGCSAKIFVPVLILLLVLTAIGFVFGPLGASLFNTTAPEILSVSKPHVLLPSEGIIFLPFFTITNTLIASWLTIIVLVVLFYFSTRKMKLIPGGLQNFAEFVVESLLNFIKSVAGDKHAMTFLPIISTIFLYVVTNAWLALLPIYNTVGFHEYPHLFIPVLRAANTDINLPLSIAIIAFLFIEYLGFKNIGAAHYIGSFFKPHELVEGFKNLFKGKIKSGIVGIGMGCINIFIGIIEVLSHFIRIISFSFRLFGNMTAGELLILVLSFLVSFVIPVIFYGLEVFFGFIQALIFAGLTLVFGTIALTPHSEE